MGRHEREGSLEPPSGTTASKRRGASPSTTWRRCCNRRRGRGPWTWAVAYRRRLSAPLYDVFLAAYRAALLATIGEPAPYLYPFQRLLIWGRLPG